MQPSIGILLRELTRLYSQAQREHVTSGHDTSSTQNHVLMELGRAGLLTQHELGRRLSLDKGWVSRAVESLVQAELVAKSRQDNDRRNRWLQLTPKGQARYQALTESLDAHADQLMQPLSTEQRQVVRQGLLLLLNSLQGADETETETPTAAVVADALQALTTAADPAPLVQQQESSAEAPVAPQPEEQEEEALELLAPAAAPAQSMETPAAAPPQPQAEPVALAKPAETEVSAEKARPVHSASASRILGSRTLPTRPLLSRTPPRTPLTRAMHAADSKDEDTSAGKPASARSPGRTETPPHVAARPPVLPPTAQQHAPATQPQHIARAPATQAPLRVAPARPPLLPPQHDRASGHGQQHAQGSIFQKILSQGSLFNKLLQREQPQEEQEVEAPAPVEVEPDDGLLFQPASPTDWNEIRNLLTANRLQVQGALNHLSNFVVATENGRVVGAIGMEVYGDSGLIRSLVVASNMRGRKIARRLIKQLIARAHTRQVGALYLLSGPVDDLFQSFGFEKMARADMPTKLYVSSEMQGPSSASPTGMRLIL